MVATTASARATSPAPPHTHTPATATTTNVARTGRRSWFHPRRSPSPPQHPAKATPPSRTTRAPSRRHQIWSGRSRIRASTHRPPAATRERGRRPTAAFIASAWDAGIPLRRRRGGRGREGGAMLAALGSMAPLSAHVRSGHETQVFSFVPAAGSERSS